MHCQGVPETSYAKSIELKEAAENHVRFVINHIPARDVYLEKINTKHQGVKIGPRQNVQHNKIVI